MICLRITDDLQQMNRPFEHLASRELWENVAKANAAAHLRWIPFLACAVTVCHSQCRERRNFGLLQLF